MSALSPETTGRAHPRHHRARWWIAGAAVCAVALTGTGIAAANGYASAPESSEHKKRYSTASIEEGTLSGSQTISGTLDYTASRDLDSGVGGVLTAAAPPGTQVGLGQALFAVNNMSVYLLHGDLPAWRAFEPGMPDGPDILQLETSLHALGYLTGEPDDDFDWHTESAIEEWQEATDQEETGRIDLGRIVFASTDLRVAEALAAIGDQVGSGVPIIRVSGLVKEVTANLKLADQKLGVVGVTVGLKLPGGITATGKISAVGQPTERDDNGQKSTVVPITITLDDPAAADGIQRANVTVDVPSETRDNVLSVPIEALMALPGGGFGIEVVRADGSTERYPVTTGLFAGGRVEISGDGIEAGLDVMVPER
jgi:membrane fusion protein (multidrug efflux system)